MPIAAFSPFFISSAMDELGFLGLRHGHRQLLAQVPVRETRLLDERQNPFISLSDTEFRYYMEASFFAAHLYPESIRLSE